VDEVRHFACQVSALVVLDLYNVKFSLTAFSYPYLTDSLCDLFQGNLGVERPRGWILAAFLGVFNLGWI
jgi:hypothetical protein